VRIRTCDGDPDSLDAALDPETEILVTDAMPTDPSKWSGLRWVQLVSSGTDQAIDHPLRHQGVAIASAAGICAVHIAEFILGRILYHTKRFGPFQHDQREKRWGNRAAMATPSLRGQHAVIVGYGGVGRETARMLSALGMRITAVMRHPEQREYNGFLPYDGIGDPDASIPERRVRDLSEVVGNADAVILTVPLNSATRHLINAQTLALFKPNAILINVSRGGVVDSDALVAALDRGELAHAYLDVFPQEPLPAASSLWEQPGISITPHMAGVMPDAALKLEQLFLVNLDRYRMGVPLINQL
jgi:phosphoglycerate dehydrogenase-like enzyme